MTDRARRVMVGLLFAGAAALLGRAVWPAPALGPPQVARRCAVPVEHPGRGVACAGSGFEPGDRVGGGRMAAERLSSLGVVLDLNRAPLGELVTLPGIGPRIAARIVDARPFASLDELARVPGIGPHRLRTIAPRLVIGVGDPRMEHGVHFQSAQEVNP